GGASMDSDLVPVLSPWVKARVSATCSGRGGSGASWLGGCVAMSRVRVASCRERPTIKNSERRRPSQLIRPLRPRSGLSSRQVSVYLANGHLFSQLVKNGDWLRRNHQGVEILKTRPVPAAIFHKLSRQRQGLRPGACA